MITIQDIQGPGLHSPLAGQQVTTTGVVIGDTRKGFFIQDPEGNLEDGHSHGIFVFSPRRQPALGTLVQVTGQVFDYLQEELGRPTTQLVAKKTKVLEKHGPPIAPFWLTAEKVLVSAEKLAVLLNSLEGMLVGIPAGSTFTAPSNPFGDYVLLPPDADLKRTQQGGVLISPEHPLRWLPSIRIIDYAKAPAVNVGSTLLEPVTGPLNFRVASYQIAAKGPLRLRPAAVRSMPTTLKSGPSAVTILTLNGFNLDPHREDPSRVKDPRRDVDDDVRAGRFMSLGRAIAKDARGPALVALQEIQDNDGAELTEMVGAEKTYAFLIAAIKRAGGPEYRWLDIPPERDQDGGQPGGNIRNAFLYDPERLTHVEGSLKRLGHDAPAFADSRKPLAARFRLKEGTGELEVINVHLASKRHQHGLFAPENPGLDPRLALRVEQAELIARHLARLREQGIDYYVTGDFNDFEFSATLRALTGDHSTNLVEQVPTEDRYDYNHRGISQALMHGVVANRQLEGRKAEYEILHANALTGVSPGREPSKPSDHAYVIARLELG
jgi:hypothetical protein